MTRACCPRPAPLPNPAKHSCLRCLARRRAGAIITIMADARPEVDAKALGKLLDKVGASCVGQAA